jgi:FkbM family methyltransferase
MRMTEDTVLLPMRRLLRSLYRRFVPLPVPPCEPETLDLLEAVLRPDSNVVDAGCNRGSILQEIVRLAPNGRHFAFEPNPMLFRNLRRAWPAVDVRRIALSDQPGRATFHLYTNFDGFSGFEAHKDVGGGDVQVIDVDTARLDDVLPREQRIDLIKIDVEGAEHRVLLGARETLARWRPVVVFECGKGGLDLYGTEPAEIVRTLESHGLRVKPLIGWRDAPPLTPEQFAAMFAEGTHFMWVAMTS